MYFTGRFWGFGCGGGVLVLNVRLLGDNGLWPSDNWFLASRLARLHAVKLSLFSCLNCFPATGPLRSGSSRYAGPTGCAVVIMPVTGRRCRLIARCGGVTVSAVDSIPGRRGIVMR